jgi:hypothetical protein
MEVAAMKRIISDLNARVNNMRTELIINGCINSQYRSPSQVNIPKLRNELTLLEEYLNLEVINVPTHINIQTKNTQEQS